MRLSVGPTSNQDFRSLDNYLQEKLFSSRKSVENVFLDFVSYYCIAKELMSK